MNSAFSALAATGQRRTRSISFAAVALLLSVVLVATSGGTAAFGADPAPAPSATPSAAAPVAELDPEGDGSTALLRPLIPGTDRRAAIERGQDGGAAALTAEAGGPSISGRVVLPSGGAMDGYLYFYTPAGDFVGYIEPDLDGRFNVATGSGKFKIEFWGFSGAASSFYGGKPTPVGATTVKATSSGTAIGKVKLAPESTISGNFAITNGDWDDSVCVDAVLDPHGDGSYFWWSNSTCADRLGGDGTWTIDRLPKGDYRLYFYDEEGSQGQWWDGPDFEDSILLPLAKNVDQFLHTGSFILAASGDADVVHGETVALGMDLDADIDGTVKLQSKKPGGSWKTLSGGMPMVDGVAVRDVAPTTGIMYRATFGYRTDTIAGWTEVPVSEVLIDTPANYFSGQPFAVDVELAEPGNGKATLQQRVNGGSWSKVDGGVNIVDGVGSRTLTRKAGDTVDYRAIFYGVTAGFEGVSRQIPTWTNEGGGDFYKGASYDIEFEADTTNLEGTGKLYVKKGSKSWKKVGPIDIVAGLATATVKPKAKTTRYQLRSGKDRSEPIVFTRVKPDLFLELDDPSDATQYIGDSFEVYITITAPDGASVEPYTGPVTLKVRKPNGDWKKVSGGIPVVTDSGFVATTALKGKRDYRVYFGGAKSNIIRVTGVTPPP